MDDEIAMDGIYSDRTAEQLKAEIVRIDTILQSGASSINVDGINVAVNTSALQESRLRLLQEYESRFARRRKPLITSVDFRRIFG